MPLIYLIRHGQASFGDENYDQLSRTGVLQSKILGEFFVESGIKFHSVVSGSLSRQIDTAKYSVVENGLYGGEIRIDPGFNEYDHKKLIYTALPHIRKKYRDFPSDLSYFADKPKDFQRFFSEMVEDWINGKFLNSDLYSYEEYSDQVISSVMKIAENAEKGSHTAVFTSGGAISVVLGRFLGISPIKAMETGWGIANSSISSFAVVDDEHGGRKDLRLRLFNSIAHLEIKNKSRIITYR